MKTIRNPATEEVLRVSDEVAATKVKDGWGYCPKEVWKSNVRDKGKEKTKATKSEKSEKKGSTKSSKGSRRSS